jgi:hypothetical protein
MELYSCKKFPGDSDNTAIDSKGAIIYSDKENLLKICSFFEKVKEHLLMEEFDNCHMHLRDNFENWNKEMFDIEINLIKKEEK